MNGTVHTSSLECLRHDLSDKCRLVGLTENLLTWVIYERLYCHLFVEEQRNLETFVEIHRSCERATAAPACVIKRACA